MGVQPGAQNVDTGVYLIPGGPQLEGSIYKVTQAYTHYFSTRGTNPVTGIRNVGDWDGDGKGEIGIAFGTTSETDAGPLGLSQVNLLQVVITEDLRFPT